MKEQGNMNKEPQRAELYFNESLRKAILSGEPLQIKTSLEHQDANEITEAISNRLIVRTFLVKQKHRLSLLDAEVFSVASQPEQIVELVRSYIKTLDDDFVDTFVDEEGEAVLSKLTGDDHFRAALSGEDEVSVNVARQFTGIDTRRLTSPAMVLGWVQDIRDLIVEVSWEGVQDVREASSMNKADAKGVHTAIRELVNGLDHYIAASLPR